MVVGASVVSVVVGTVSVAAAFSAGVVSATVVSVVAALVSVVAWVVPDAVEAVAVSAVSSPAVVCGGVRDRVRSGLSGCLVRRGSGLRGAGLGGRYG